jgi:hypothetical protein
VMVTAGGSYYAPLADIDFSEGGRAMDEHVWLTCASASTPPPRCGREGR